jgi:hypothetical protein
MARGSGQAARAARATLSQLFRTVVLFSVSRLHVTHDQKLSLSELRGRPFMLPFYAAELESGL